MAQSKYEAQAAHESAVQKALKEWIRRRIGNIHEHVTVYDVLSRRDVSLPFEGRPVQFSCPFHGRDTSPSARAYPESNEGPSHVWCFVCQERWDVISLWRKFEGGEKKFTRSLSEIEQAFALDRPAFPEGVEGFTADSEELPEQNFEMFQRLYRACDQRLREAKVVYDMQGYLKAVTVLERVYNQVMHSKLPLEEGERVLRVLLDKIGERLRSCPAG